MTTDDSNGQIVAKMVAVIPGRVLQGVFGLVGVLRPAAKPLHPSGRLRASVIERHGLEGTAATGVEWIDRPGTTEALVRMSRATGLPESLPDIRGMAIRIPAAPDGPADLLLASTGLGRFSRFILVPSFAASGCAYSTLLPYRTDNGPILIAACPDPADPDRFELACAAPRGPWRAFADLQLGRDIGTGDESLSFDPILHQLPRLDCYPWAAQLREGAYRAARWSRNR